MERRDFFRRSTAVAVAAGVATGVAATALAASDKAVAKELTSADLQIDMDDLLERPHETRGYDELLHDSKVRYTLTQKVIGADASVSSKAAALKRLLPEMNQYRPVMAEDIETTNDILRFVLGALAGE